MATTIDQLALMADTVVDGDLLVLRDVSVTGNNKDLKLTIGKLKSDVIGATSVLLTGDQTVAGVKTFSRDVVVSKTRPAFVANGGSRPTRFAAFANGNSHQAVNLSFDGSGWNLDDTSGPGAVLSVDAGSAGISMQLRVATAGANPRTLTELLRITTGGDFAFGVGGTPGKRVDINGDVRIRGDSATLNFYRTTGPTDIAYIAYSDADQQLNIAANNKFIRFLNLSGFGESMRIATNGNVGIGDPAPAALLTLKQPVADMTGGILLIASNGYFGSGMFREDGAAGGLILRSQSDNTLIVKGGYVGIGTTLPAGKVHIDQASTTAAIPVLVLDQADLSEEFIQFDTTVGAGNPVDTAALGTYYGKARVSVNGTMKFVALYNS